MSKPLLKLLHVDIKKEHCSVNGVSIYVDNITTSIIDTKYNIFMSPKGVYSANNLILVTLLPSPFRNKASSFLLFKISFFFLQRFSLFIVFTGCFTWNFDLPFSSLIWFIISFGYLDPVTVFFLQNELIMILNFSPRRFVSLNNLRTLK